MTTRTRTTRTTTPRTSKNKAVSPDRKRCDNHPDREAVFQTSSGRAHQWIHFCNDCIPKHWR